MPALAALLNVLMFFEKDQPDQHNDNSQNEHEDGYPVDPMHVPHPLRIRLFRVPLFDVEIFCYLS